MKRNDISSINQSKSFASDAIEYFINIYKVRLSQWVVINEGRATDQLFKWIFPEL